MARPLHELLNVSVVAEELQQRLPRLLFAACNPWPLAGGLAEGQDDNAVSVLAVRSVPVSDRLDDQVASELDVLVAGKIVQEQARLLDFTLPSAARESPSERSDVRLLVCWHDLMEFVSLLQKGNPAWTEALASAERPLFESEEFSELRSIVGKLELETILKSKQYLMACAGQAMSFVSPPRKPKANVDVSCLSASDFSLLQSLCRRMICNAESEQLETIEELTRNGECNKSEWYPVVKVLFDKASKASDAKDAIKASAIESWADRLRNEDFEDFTKACVCNALENQQRLTGDSSLDIEWKTRLEEKWPMGAELVFLTQTGSFMYNVQMPSSDSDFSIIFMSPARDLCRREPPASDFQYHACATFGSDKRGEIEYSGRELGTFLVDLAKGNARNVEMLFCANPNLTSPVWQELQDMRRMFITIRCAQQYSGFILDRLKNAQRSCADMKKNGFSEFTATQISKLFYHAYHKIFDLARILDGSEPAVGLVGEEREFVLKLRQEPPRSLDEALSRVAEIQKRHDELRNKLSEVEQSEALPREVDVEVLKKWLRGIRTRHMIESLPMDKKLLE